MFFPTNLKWERNETGSYGSSSIFRLDRGGSNCGIQVSFGLPRLISIMLEDGAIIQYAL